MTGEACQTPGRQREREHPRKKKLALKVGGYVTAAALSIPPGYVAVDSWVSGATEPFVDPKIVTIEKVMVI